MKRIVICSDGTWSTPDRESPTNVTRMAASMESLRARGGGEEATQQAGRLRRQSQIHLQEAGRRLRHDDRVRIRPGERPPRRGWPVFGRD